MFLCAASAESAQTIRQYSVGNSLTGINFQNYAAAAASRGNTATWGLHLQPGATLDFILQTPSNGQTISEQPYGTYNNALANYTWDAVVVEPFNRALGGATGDLNNVHNFVNLIQPQSPNAQLYIYETWPTKNAGDGSLNYHDWWLANYDGTDDITVRSRSFFDNLMTQLRATSPSLSKPALMIPAGEDAMKPCSAKLAKSKPRFFKFVRETSITLTCSNTCWEPPTIMLLRILG